MLAARRAGLPTVLVIPVTAWHDGVRFEEVSLGYRREWVESEWGTPGPGAILGAVAVEATTP